MIVDRLLAETGSTPYHVCYESDDFEKELNHMLSGGYRIVTEPAIAAALEERKIVFLYSLPLELVEMVEG